MSLDDALERMGLLPPAPEPADILEESDGPPPEDREWLRLVDLEHDAQPAGGGSDSSRWGELGETDVDNAERLRILHGDRVRYVHAWGTWIVWDGRRWVRDPEGVMVGELAKDVSRRLFEDLASGDFPADRRRQLANWAAQSAGRSRISAMVSLARGLDGILIKHEDLDADPWALGVVNGWVDLRTGRHHPPDPHKLMTMQAGTSDVPGAAAPTWEKALAEWLPDPDVRDYFQRLCGASLVGQTKDHLLVIVWGPGGNGKSTALGAIGAVLGDYFVVPHRSLLVTDRHPQHATVVATLFRARMAVASETERHSRLNDASIKNLTGGDQLRARRLYENEWSFTPSHTLWLQTNHLPEVQGRDKGIWRRIKVLPWESTFSGPREDRDLPDKLKDEAPGILNWLLEGVARWQQVGLGDDTVPEAVRRATDQYRRSEDIVGRWLADAGYAVSQGLSTPATELADSWKSWTEREYGRARRFHEVADYLTQLGCRRDEYRYTDDGGKRRKATVWLGVGQTDEPTEEQLPIPEDT